MNRIYLIQHRAIDRIFFENRIKSIGNWIKYFEDSWIVETTMTAQQIYDYLSVGQEKTAFIIELSKTNYWGRMNNNLWEYLKTKK
jgi:hypothetical protein